MNSTQGSSQMIRILHLSDIHLGTKSEATKYRVQLESDLSKELGIEKLDYIVISGDIANYSTLEEYSAAFELVVGVSKSFGLDLKCNIVVPGNHDLNWELANAAYFSVSNEPKNLLQGKYILAGVGTQDALLCNEELYKERFDNFNEHFYKQIYGKDYPKEYSEQGILHINSDQRILFLALNSSWEIAKTHRDRSGINTDALYNALDRIKNCNECDEWLKIAIWHHPVTGNKMMKNVDFLQQLSVHGFKVCMHGHVHEAEMGFYSYDSSRGIHIVGAGTFGAPTNEQVPGIPLQYNLLIFDRAAKTITVETRKKEKPNGAWSADARWGDRNDPKPRYSINLYHAAEGTKLIKHNLPIEPPNVVGRDEEHKYILTTLVEAHIPIILTSGFGGIGKSTLAKVAAWSFYKQKTPFNFIAWIDIRKYSESQTISLKFILDEIAKTADTQSDIPSISHLDVKQDRVKEILKSHRSLIILDNYEDLLADPSEEKKVSLFLGSLPIGSMKDQKDTFIRILITTRQVSNGLRQLPLDDLRLEKLSLKESIQLMKLWTPAHLELNDDQYKTIWEVLFGLPKYMQIAIDQLRTITFNQWIRMIKNIEVPLDEGERFFRDLFDRSWGRFSEDFKKILMAMTYFVGEASPAALQETSGLPLGTFDKVLSSVSDAYIESTGTRYAMHPLTHSFCRAVLNCDVFNEFRIQSSFRFVKYFLDFSIKAHQAVQPGLLEPEARNLIAAAKLAYDLKAWADLIQFREGIGAFLRNNGYWQEQKEITLSITEACRHLEKKDILAECLVDDLSYLILRFEDLEEAEKYNREGLELFQQLGRREGTAQAMRHFGKSSLLKGLDPYYKPIQYTMAKKYFDEAEQYYTQSLKILNDLKLEGIHHPERIGYIKLDFGRLYWLQGQNSEIEGREQKNENFIKEALDKYNLANQVSEEGKALLVQIGSDRGVSKAWGNLGNANKELARYFQEENQFDEVKQHIGKANKYYEKSLEIAEKLKRKDEIAHAQWGLAEVYEFYADQPGPQKKFETTVTLLKKALGYAEESNRLYKSLFGRKDINATGKLVEQIKGKLSQLERNTQDLK